MLIRQAHVSIRSAEGQERRRCRAAAADLYRLVQRLLAHICESELHALAVERGRALSEEADSRLSLAQAAWASSVGLCASGYPDDAAARTADRLPNGVWHLPSAFDRTNVQILAVIVEVSLHRNGEALHNARKIDLASTPSVVRRSRLLLECAQAHANRREWNDAVDSLGAATKISPEAIGLIPWARSLADELAEQAHGAARSEAKRLTSRLKATA